MLNELHSFIAKFMNEFSWGGSYSSDFIAFLASPCRRCAWHTNRPLTPINNINYFRSYTGNLIQNRTNNHKYIEFKTFICTVPDGFTCYKLFNDIVSVLNLIWAASPRLALSQGARLFHCLGTFL